MRIVQLSDMHLSAGETPRRGSTRSAITVSWLRMRPGVPGWSPPMGGWFGGVATGHPLVAGGSAGPN